MNTIYVVEHHCFESNFRSTKMQITLVDRSPRLAQSISKHVALVARDLKYTNLVAQSMERKNTRGSTAKRNVFCMFSGEENPI